MLTFWQKGEILRLRSRALIPYRLQLHRAIRNRDPERRADSAFHEMDVAAVRTHQFRCDRKTEAAAARACRPLEGLEQMVARLLRNARAGV